MREGGRTGGQGGVGPGHLGPISQGKTFGFRRGWKPGNQSERWSHLDWREGWRQKKQDGWMDSKKSLQDLFGDWLQGEGQVNIRKGLIDKVLGF